MNQHERNLKIEMFFISDSQTWDEILKEWELVEVEMAEKPHECICGHGPIFELCRIRSNKNGRSTIVGNCCIEKYFGLGSGAIFRSIKNTKKDIERSHNTKMIEFAYKKGVINSWERSFYLDICRKRILSQKQMAVKVKLNKKIASMGHQDRQ